MFKLLKCCQYVSYDKSTTTINLIWSECDSCLISTKNCANSRIQRLTESSTWLVPIRADIKPSTIQ